MSRLGVGRVFQERHLVWDSPNLTGRILSPSRSQMLSPKITSEFFFILGDKLES